MKLFLACTILSVNYRKTSHLSVCIRMGVADKIKCYCDALSIHFGGSEEVSADPALLSGDWALLAQ